MALPPKFAGLRLLPGGSAAAVHSLDLYLDYTCPYSKKLFETFYQHAYPLVRDKYAGKLAVIFRPQIQPWHPSSTLTHEAATAVLRLAPQHFWAFSAQLFRQQTEFFDVNVVEEKRNQTYQRLAHVAAKVGLDFEAVYRLLKVRNTPADDGSLNVGNLVTDDVKFMVKANRLLGIHVTPTVLFNGVVENAISSSFSGKDWEEWLLKNVG